MEKDFEISMAIGCSGPCDLCPGVFNRNLGPLNSPPVTPAYPALHREPVVNFVQGEYPIPLKNNSNEEEETGDKATTGFRKRRKPSLFLVGQFIHMFAREWSLGILSNPSLLPQASHIGLLAQKDRDF